jgi:hypothetical protein
VELTKLEAATENNRAYRPSIPCILLPMIEDTKTINPGASAVFKLFAAQKNELASGNRVLAFIMDATTATVHNVASFEVNTNYKLQITYVWMVIMKPYLA